jgi:hypothetical protein
MSIKARIVRRLLDALGKCIDCVLILPQVSRASAQPDQGVSASRIGIQFSPGCNQITFQLRAAWEIHLPDQGQPEE